MSFWNKPIVALIKQVRLPNVIMMILLNELFINKGDNLINKKTPAVTIVAACIKALTGVGPSIASGSQECNPTWADLLVIAIIKNILIELFM